MLRRIGVAVAVASVILLGYAGMQPDSFRVERSITVKAPPEDIFPLINDYRAWTSWSPWEKKDPAMKRAYEGAASGAGAIYAWSGNSEVGSGRMEIIQSVPSSKVAMDLHFMTPFEARNTTEFMLEAQGDSTTVTWAMFGPSPFMSKVMGLFMSMDEMVGGDFETGLANLRRVAESGAAM